MTGTRENLIVAGVDGSPASEAAALWAAAEAQRRGASLRLVHAYAVPTLAAGRGSPPGEIGGAVIRSAEALLDDTVAVIRKAHPGLDVTTLLDEDSPVGLLRKASERAALTVVGSHGKHQLTETLLGSVAARINGHAHSPVVVIRTDPAGRPTGGEGPVVVGLDGSAESVDALEFALKEAAMRRTALIAIRVWDDSALDGFQVNNQTSVDRGCVDDQERELLNGQLKTRTGQFPEVQVRPLVLRGRPAATLLRYCASAGTSGQPSLLVVGSRGRGAFTGMLLGSTSHALIAGATCGVAVVRPETWN